MSERNYRNIEIHIEKEEVTFRALVGDALVDDGAADYNTDNSKPDYNIRIELSISKVFHKVLNLIKNDQDLFQKEDYELLGEMLGKILFGKIDNIKDSRRSVMRNAEYSLNISGESICRILLEFDPKSGIEMLPWEYILYRKLTGDSKSIYLAANVKSGFQLIRKVKNNENRYPEYDKLFMIVLINVDGNREAKPPIDSRIGELDEIESVFKNLKNKFPDSFVYKFIKSTPFNEINQEVEDTYHEWEKIYGCKPDYVLHYVGHSMLEKQIGKLVLKDADTGNPGWAEDKKFAALFNDEKLNVRQPSLVCFQSCDSAKIGSYGDELRGVAYEFTKINIPAVIGMQNEINTPNSNAFFERFYENILKAKDVSEAATAGRDYLGREFGIKDDVYCNNSFGSPVLFITTKEPIRLIKPEIKEVKEEKFEKFQESPEYSRSVSNMKNSGERQVEIEKSNRRTGLNNEENEIIQSPAMQKPYEESAAIRTQVPDDTASPKVSLNPKDI
ncbi:MAG: CHAT domain-containing protein [Ignavibacteria bacterium]|nr:CHAT domain-containing protein [Ignavibacteria bacterium]